MKYIVCYRAGHTRAIEFAGMTWTPGELVEFSKPDDIPDAVREDARFDVAKKETGRKKKIETVPDEPIGLEE